MQPFPSKAPLLAFAMIVLQSMTACGKIPTVITAPLPAAVQITETDSLSGKVSLTGGKPSSLDQTIDVGGNPFCTGHGTITNPGWRVSAIGGLADAVISVRKTQRASNINESPLIDQKDCQFHPYLTVIQAGQEVRLHNSDLTFHNIRIVRHQEGTLSDGDNLVNLAQPSKGDENVHIFSTPGIYRLECDVHRWMKAWVYVHDGIHVTSTDAEGRFILNRALQDGTYEISVWHPKFPARLSRTIAVAQGRAQADFTFDLSNSFDP